MTWGFAAEAAVVDPVMEASAAEPSLASISTVALAATLSSASAASTAQLGPVAANNAGKGVLAAATASLDLGGEEMDGASEASWLQADEVFDRLKVLEGTWQAHFIDADAPSFTVVYQLSARDSVLIETSHPGAHIEMKTIFLVVDGELQVQHLCAFGSQPQMRLDRSQGNGYDLYFQHSGGTNLRAEDAMWMRLDRLSLFNEDYFETEWSTFKGAETFGPAQGIAMVRME